MPAVKLVLLNHGVPPPPSTHTTVVFPPRPAVAWVIVTMASAAVAEKNELKFMAVAINVA